MRTTAESAKICMSIPQVNWKTIKDRPAKSSKPYCLHGRIGQFIHQFRPISDWLSVHFLVSQ